MDRIADPARAALDQALEPTRPRRRWSDAPRYPWSEEAHVRDWSLDAAWPALSACTSECMADIAHGLQRELRRLQKDGRLSATDATPLGEMTQSLMQASRTLQQVVRFGGGAIQPSAERVDLVALVRDTVQEMRTDLRRRGAEVTFDIRPAEVLIDAAVALELVTTGLQWALSFSPKVHVQLQQPERGRARLVFRGHLARPGGAGTTSPRRSNRRMNSNLHWVLLRQLASLAQLPLSRTSSPSTESAAFDFERTFHSVDGLASVELLGDSFTRSEAPPWVLVIVRDRALREAVLRLLIANGLEAEGAQSCDEARALCGSRKPRVLVGCDQGYGVAELRREFVVDGHRCGHIHVMRDTPSFHLHGFAATDLVRVGRRELDRDLVPSVLFEIAHQQ